MRDCGDACRLAEACSPVVSPRLVRELVLGTNSRQSGCTRAENAARTSGGVSGQKSNDTTTSVKEPTALGSVSTGIARDVGEDAGLPSEGPDQAHAQRTATGLRPSRGQVVSLALIHSVPGLSRPRRSLTTNATLP